MPRRHATRTYRPSRSRTSTPGRRPRDAEPASHPQIPRSLSGGTVRVGSRVVRVTNLQKPFWPELGITKRDLIQYYIDVAPALLPHLRGRAMVMKRYPHGAAGEFFFMKRAPSPRPEWIELCSIEHASDNVIDFPVINDLASLVWVVNLGCIDLNPWYARCDDADRPDYLHFDLDPVKADDPKREVPFERVREAALRVRDALAEMGMEAYAKTSGSRGIHLYVPIHRGPTQKQVWMFAKGFAKVMEKRHPDLITGEYRIARRPPGRVLVDYNQNAWGRTLASVYSVRPRPRATVSTPVTWKEIERGVAIEDFRIDNVPARVQKLGDLFAPLLHDASPRVRLEDYFPRPRPAKARKEATR